MPLSRKSIAYLWLAALLCALPAASSGQEAKARPSPAKRKAAPANAPAAGKPERVTSVEGITEYRLANGLHVLLFPDPTKQTITVNITYLVGSRNENYGETGMAHLLEHLMFKGTPRHPNIPQELTAHGARPNGSTWLDRTNYFETFQATRGEPEVGARPRGRPDGPLLHREEGPGQRDDRRAQRVRDGREQPLFRPLRARRLDGLSLAQLRPLDHRRPRRHRERADREAAGLLEDLLPAR